MDESGVNEASNKFRERYDLDARKRHFERVMASSKAEGRTPVILEPEPGCKFDTDAFKTVKRLCDRSITMSHMVLIARANIPSKLISPNEAIYLLVGEGNNTLVNGPTPIADVYDKYKDEDGFLYITFTSENTFG